MRITSYLIFNIIDKNHKETIPRDNRGVDNTVLNLITNQISLLKILSCYVINCLILF